MRDMFDWVGLFANIAAIATSVAIPLYKSYVPTQSRLAYAVNPVPAVVGDRSLSSKIRVFVGKDLAKTRVLASQVMIFNDGLSKINYGDITKDKVRIEIRPHTAFIDAVLRSNTAGTGFKIYPAESDSAAGVVRVPVTWDFLEREDGGVVQIYYYAEKKPLDLKVVGRVLPGGPKNVPIRVAIERNERMNELKRRGWVFVLMMLAEVLLGGLLAYAALERRIYMAILNTLGFLAMTLLLVWQIAQAVLPRLPLSF